MIDNITISVSVFFAFFITLYHVLHCYYVAKDPEYKGKLSIGWPWLHYNDVNLNRRVPWYKNYIFQSALTLFICSLIISFVVFDSFFISKEISFDEIFKIILALIVICVFSQFIGAAAYKGWLSILLIILISILLYRWTDYYREDLVNYAIISTIPILTGTASFWMKIMYKGKPKKYVFIMGLYSAVSPILTWIFWLMLMFYIYGF